MERDNNSRASETALSASPALKPLPSPLRRWTRRLGMFTAFPLLGGLFLGGISMATAWTNLGARPKGERLERISSSPQFEAETRRFANSLRVLDPPLGPVLRDWIRGGQNTVPESPPPLSNTTLQRLATPPDDDLRITWLGHSTMLVEIDGARFLTDPVWGERTSPWSMLGPKRFHRPPLAIADLPPIDAVIISHDHYDHLDASTIPQLADRVPLFLAPLGVGSHLEYWGVPPEKIIELDWWEEREIAGVRMVATPARHFSGRSIGDRNKTLWASWAFVGPQHRAYFSGDTGMFPGFKEIGQRLGPFNIAMIESGAYNKMWADVHLGPEQALQAFQDLRGELFMPVHWGTFDLAMHAWTEPVERILSKAKQLGISVAVPQPGGSIEPSKPTKLVQWWPDLPFQSAEEHPVVSSGLEMSPSSIPAQPLATAVK